MSRKPLVSFCMAYPLKFFAVFLELVKSMKLLMQEIKPVIPDNSLAQSEEEQLHALSKRRKLESGKPGKATSAIQKVKPFFFSLTGLSQSMYIRRAVFCPPRNCSWTYNLSC